MLIGLQNVIWTVSCKPGSRTYIFWWFYKYSFVPFSILASSRLPFPSLFMRLRLCIQRENTRVLISTPFFFLVIKLNNWGKTFPSRLWLYNMFCKCEIIVSILCAQRSFFLERLTKVRKVHFHLSCFLKV